LQFNRSPGRKKVAVIVAHPDDETLWAGGTILSHPGWSCFILCLSRAKDTERASGFYNALKVLKCEGVMGDIDDGPDQIPLNGSELELAISGLLPPKQYDLMISHNPSGEYTRHIRHEEVSTAVIKLWHSGKITASELWTFAYEDGRKEYYPRSEENAPIYRNLTKRIWKRKYSIITETYGFATNSWEAETTPRSESFWQFSNSYDSIKWLNNGGIIS
jgi:LmbE family N-acetylglucosaminyl deacetylase